MQNNIIKAGLIWLALVFSNPLFANSPLKPDPQITPGEALTTDTNRICTRGYAKSVRAVPSSIKRMVYRLYGIKNRNPGEYEVDHLISLELGGANSIQNLWPQSFLTMPLNAHVKDTLENKLHELICSGRINVHQAQQEIAADWTLAYEKYVGPLPGRAESRHALSTPATDEPAESEGEKHASITGNCPQEAPVKVSKRGIYHLKSDPNYYHTKAIDCFPSAAAAEASGFRAPKDHENH